MVQAGKSTAGVSGAGNTKTTITDRVGATLKSKGTVTIPKDRPWTKVTLALRGVAKPVAVGDRIASSSLPAKVLDVLPNTMALSKPDGGSLTATCFEGGRYAVISGGVVRAQGIAGTGGAVSVSTILGAGSPMPTGTLVVLACMTPDALGQIFTATAG